MVSFNLGNRDDKGGIIQVLLAFIIFAITDTHSRKLRIVEKHISTIAKRFKRGKYMSIDSILICPYLTGTSLHIAKSFHA